MLSADIVIRSWAVLGVRSVLLAHIPDLFMDPYFRVNASGGGIGADCQREFYFTCSESLSLQAAVHPSTCF